MAQGVPEKPELETRTFRPSSGAALTATGFIDDTTKQKQFAAGLSAFSNLLKRGGEFEQKRRVFNDKIIAQTAITLGERNPAFLTNEGQLEYNNLLAGKAADEFNLKFGQHAKIHSRNLLGQKGISFVDKAALFNQSLDDLVTANVSGLQFNNAQKTIYGEKVLAHKLKLLNAFQEVNIEFVEQNTIDTQNSGMTQSFLRAAGVGEPDELAPLVPESGLLDGKRELPTEARERIKAIAFGTGIDKKLIMDWDKSLSKQGIGPHERITMMINSLELVGRETNNPFIFSVLNQDLGGGFNPATGSHAQEIETARRGLSSEYRSALTFRQQQDDRQRKTVQDSLLDTASAELFLNGAVDMPLTPEAFNVWIKEKYPGMKFPARSTLRTAWGKRIGSKLNPPTSDFRELKRVLNSGTPISSEEWFTYTNGLTLGTGELLLADDLYYSKVSETIKSSEVIAQENVDRVVIDFENILIFSDKEISLGTSPYRLRNESVLDLGPLMERAEKAGSKNPILTAKRIMKLKLSEKNKMALSQYSYWLTDHTRKIFLKVGTDNFSVADATAEAEKFILEQRTDFLKGTGGENFVSQDTRTILEARKEKTETEDPVKGDTPDPPNVPDTSSEVPPPQENALINPASPAEKNKNQEQVARHEQSPIAKMMVTTGKERDEFEKTLKKVGAIVEDSDKLFTLPGQPIVPYETYWEGVESTLTTTLKSSLVFSFVEKLTDKFQQVGEKVKKTGKQIKEGLKEGLISVQEGIKRLMNGDKPTSEPNPAVIEFKKEYNLNDISDPEVGRIMKHTITKKGVVVNANKQQASKDQAVQKGTSILAKLKESGVSSAKPFRENIKAIKTIPGGAEFLSSIKANVSAFVRAVEDRAISAEYTLEENIRVIQKYKQGDADEVSPDTTDTIGGTVTVPPVSVGEPEDKGEEISSIKALGTLALRSANSVIDLISGEAEAATSDITLTKKPLLSAALFGSNFYNASPTESERIAWAKNADAGIRKYKANKLNKKEQINVTKMLTTLSKAKSSFVKDLKVIGITFEHFKDLMIGVYAAETSFGTSKSKISRTGVVGELQVTRGTFRDISKPRGNFGPLMAKEVGITIQKIRKFSDLELKALLLNNNKFNYLAGAAVMLSKLQNAKKKIKRGR